MDNKKDILPVDAIKHEAEKRADIPTTEMAGYEKEAIKDKPKDAEYSAFRHDFERGRDPEIYWIGKYRNDSEETQRPDLKVDTRSLYVHEDIRPETLVNKLYKMREREGAQPILFAELEAKESDYADEIEKITKYYQHSADWKNRLIQGDSLLVMNSLLQREGMEGKVQCIYIDPPYGIKYGSNWQMKLNSRDVKDNDESLSGEPETIKAFRDTWELGIHSYLSYLRDRLVLARELLTESGSCFVQISDENVHLVRNLMDEVFGSENFVSQIFYKKTSGAGSPNDLLGLAGIGDYIIWFAKDKKIFKYRALYIPKEYGGEGSSPYRNIELKSGERLSISEWEKRNNTKFDYSDRPQGSRVYTLDNFVSHSGGEIGKFEIEFKGNLYKAPSNGIWKTNKMGVKNLISVNRIDVSSNGRIGYIRYFDDFKYQILNNLWTDAGSSFMEKFYIVQSSMKAIQRCILMTTDPGDLVLDPTCGSGTTAYVSEQWGRRWITIDTSRIALNIAKKRLATAKFPYYKLFDEKGGDIRQGFKYKTVPHVTLKTLANDEPADEEILYDQPEEDSKKLRVSGPFTVETLQNFVVRNPDEKETEEEEDRRFVETIFEHLQSSGIKNGVKEEAAKFYSLEQICDPYLNAKGRYKDADGNECIAFFHIGPKFGTVSKRAVSEAVKKFRPKAEYEGASWLVILGFSFEDSIETKNYQIGEAVLTKTRMHDDLLQEGLLKKDKNAGSFITIGEPDIALIDSEDGKTCHVEIQGLDIYDPMKDEVKERNINDIAYWEIDDDYDGEKFIVRGMYFCGGDKKEYDQWRKGLESLANASAKRKKQAEQTLKLEIDEELWDNLYSFRSAPIEKREGRKICVRVISQFGEEASRVIEM